MYYDDPTQPVQYVRETRQPRRRGCLGGCFSRLLLVGLLGVGLLVFAGILIGGTLVYNQLNQDIEQGIAALDAARTRDTFETTRIFDRNGQLLWEFFGEGNRTQIPLSQIPQNLIDATIAIEDDSFYENNGLDAPSLVAAIIANLRHPEGRPIGGSTITQQLVRHVAFDYDERTAVSYNRKTKEIILAWIMNRKYSKDEILELYLNEIYYGNLAYGIEAAAQTYFEIPARDLDLAQAALLAGLPQSPIELDPLTNPDAAKERQWLVLSQMVRDDKISQEEANAAYLEPLTFAPQEVSLVAPHFAVYVRQQLEAQFGADVVANGGLQVTTTLDLDYQRLAELLARQHVAALAADHHLTNAALVALKPGTGEILAMLGSVDYKDETIDGNVNVALSPQQPGSAIKPITYAAALSPDPNTGTPTWTAADLLWDVPVSYPQFDGSTYSPVNYDGRFHGPVRLREALANSYNVPAVLLLQDIGISRFLELARQMGVSSFDADPSRYGLALTLGGGEVTPLELTAAYAVFANGGFRIPPVSILRVSKTDGTVLYEVQSPEPEQVLDPRVAYLISNILDDDAARVPAMGRNNPLALPFPAAAKTGTTNDFRDNWTVGYTPGLAVGVWTGNTDNSEMINVSGLTGAAPLWSAYMQAVYADFDLVARLAGGGAQPPTAFVQPAGLAQKPLCALSSVTPGAGDCVYAGNEWFLQPDVDAPTPTPTATQDPADERVVWEMLEPGVWRMPAIPLPPNIITTATTDDQDALPPQPFCQFAPGVEVALLPPNALPQVFLTAPRNPESLKGAYAWAEANGVVVMPAAPCTDELLAQARDPNAPAVWRITSPRAGDEVSGILPIMGTADFDPGVVQFYKVEVRLGDNWITLGDTHNTPVVNGVLESLHADGLPAGPTEIRLIVILWDGNYVGEPYTVPITIVRP
ncbi:MAG: transglycosylase domain-containing protein [Anaerolineales bacterium]|nr:transglycosylase domain-containing protein [Anaerolineales bacterium]MCB8951008.1 transglycosylase domain-containing protein [Ardenticatenales bacterium]